MMTPIDQVQLLFLELPLGKQTINIDKSDRLLFQRERNQFFLEWVYNNCLTCAKLKFACFVDLFEIAAVDEIEYIGLDQP